MNETAITVETVVRAPVETVWTAWTQPEHITRWNFASDDWHCPRAVNDLRPGGQFSYTMAARDGSMAFEFGGEYEDVQPQEHIRSRLGDGRAVLVTFGAQGAEHTRVTETFEPEGLNPPEMQRAGWQAILDNFRRHVESGVPST